MPVLQTQNVPTDFDKFPFIVFKPKVSKDTVHECLSLNMSLLIGAGIVQLHRSDEQTETEGTLTVSHSLKTMQDSTLT